MWAGFAAMGVAPPGPPAALPQRHPARPRPRLVVRRDRRRARPGPGAGGRGTGCCPTTSWSASPPTSRATPTTSPRPCWAASRSRARGDELVRRPRARRRAGPGRRLRPARTRCPPSWPAGCCPHAVPHADAAADAGRAALLVAALGRAPGTCCAATRDYLHQEYRRPAMPDSLALVDALRGDGVPAVVSGAGPTVLAFVADGVPGAARPPTTGWWPAAPRRVGRPQLLGRATAGRRYTRADLEPLGGARVGAASE